VSSTSDDEIITAAVFDDAESKKSIAILNQIKA
jgi:hypothetical protein